MPQPERWSNLFELFDQAVEATEEERAELLRKTETHDSALARHLSELLAGHFGEQGVLDGPLRDLDAEEWLDSQIGRELGPYVLGEMLGQGGMGVVFAAQQEQPIRRRVAIKLIKLGMDTAEVLRRFRHEQQALARMEHANIARVLDAGTSPEGAPYFVMEYVDGTAIDEFCDGRGLDIEARIALLIDVCRAVHHAHQKGIIHRDLKPSNVLVRETEDNTAPVIIDFGVAKAVDASDSSVTGASRVIGTPDYMSPEQRRHGADIDTRADIYGLGALLFTLLSGSRPVGGTTATTGELPVDNVAGLRPSRAFAGLPDEHAAEAAEFRSTTPRALQKRLTGELDWITHKATAQSPDDRYAAASDLANDLSAYLRQLPVAAGPPSRGYRLRKFVARNRGAVAAVAAVLAAGLAFSAGYVIQSREVERAYVAAEEQLARTERVTQLLTDLFEGADPVAAGGEVTTTIETLEHGLERIEVQLADAPDIRADLLIRLAEVYTNLGRYDRADELLVEALEIRALLPHHDPVQDIPVLIDLSTVRATNAAFTAGLEAANRALELTESDPDIPRLDRARAVIAVANVHVYAGAYTEARPLFREALDIRLEDLPAGHSDIGEAQNGLGVTLGRLGEYEESEELLRTAIANAESQEPVAETSLATRLMNLSLTQRNNGDFDEALATSARAFEIRSRIYGPEHPETAIILENRAQILSAAGQTEEALAMLEEVIEMRGGAGTADPRLATTWSNYGVALRSARRYDEAIEAYKESLAIRERTGTLEGTQGAIVTHNLAVALSQVQRNEEALAYSERAVALFRTSYGDGTVMVSIGLMRLARERCVTGDAEGSERDFAEAKTIQDATLPADHWRVSVREISHGRCQYERGEYEPAEAHFLAGIAIAEAALGPDHVNTTRGRELLARLYDDTGRGEDAARLRAQNEGGQ